MRIYWLIIVVAFVVQHLLHAMLSSAIFAVMGRFMLTLGAPVWNLHERFANSPLGYFLTALSFIVSYLGGGYTISYLLRRWRRNTDNFVRMRHVIVFLLVYIVIYILALGLNVPGYATRLTFGETVTWLCAGFAAFVGALMSDNYSSRPATIKTPVQRQLEFLSNDD